MQTIGDDSGEYHSDRLCSCKSRDRDSDDARDL